MLKMKFWFEGNQLQPDCNIHGGCKIGSSACHACPHCVRVNSKDQEVLCLGDDSVQSSSQRKNEVRGHHP